MSMATQTGQEGSPSAPAQTSSVHMGRQDFFSVVLRLTSMELYKLRRRLMSKVLGIIAVLAVVLALLLITLLTAIQLPSAAGQDTASGTSELLRLPLSLYLATQIAVSVGLVIIAILAGAIVGGEYGVGTLRLMFTRGPSRTQFLISKVAAITTCIAIGVLGVTLINVLLGSLLNVTTGIVPSFDFFSIGWIGHALLYLLITMLGLFVYAMMALFMATLGRSTAAGIAGVLLWAFIEPVVLNPILIYIASITNGATADFFRAVPDYFIGNTLTALRQNQEAAVFPGTPLQAPAQANPHPLSNVHSLLVLAGYLVVFIGLAWWVNERRDVTN